MAGTRSITGIEITGRKRFSSRWLMNSSVSFNNTRGFNPVATRDYTDPTNREFTEGRESSGLNGATWMVKLAGMYALPWNMSMSAFYNVREGLQFNRTMQSPNRTGGLAAVNVLIEPQDTRHYPVHKPLDVNWDKTVSFGRRSITFSATGFNVLNASTAWAVKRGRTSRAQISSRRFSPRVFSASGRK